MAKFIFRLQSFLNVKEKIEEQKRAEYGKAVSKLEEEKDKLIQIFEKKENSVSSMKNSINVKINSNQIRNFNQYLDFLDKEVVRQKQVIEEYKQNVEKVRLELVEAMKERKMLETLKEKEKDKYFKEELQKEQKMIDEIVSYKYNIKS